MKKLSLKKTVLRHLNHTQLARAAGGFITTNGGNTISCHNTCGCPVQGPGPGSLAWTCAHSCLVCGPI